MEVEEDISSDGDIEARLLQQFGAMGTTDKEVLISQFQKLLGDQLNPATCAFFLDMNNWNLQAGICSYLDFEQPNNEAVYLCNVQCVDEFNHDTVPIDTSFTKTWRLHNNGSQPWPGPSCVLRLTESERLTVPQRILVRSLSPGDTIDINIDITTPTQPGSCRANWRMSTPSGVYFGDPVVVSVIAAQDKTIQEVTQQLSALTPNNGLSHCIQSNLPTTVCVDTIPINSMPSMRTNHGETMSLGLDMPKSSPHVSRNFENHPKDPEQEDCDMTS